MTRYRYSCTLGFGNEGEHSYSEIDVTVSFTVLPGRAETPPCYDHGGLPAESAEVDDLRLELVDGKPGPWDLTYGFEKPSDTIERILDKLDLDELLQTAAEDEEAQCYG